LAHGGPRDVVFSVPEDKRAMIQALRGREGAVDVQLWGEAQLRPATVREVAAAADATTRTLLVKADIGPGEVTLGQTAAVLIRAPQPQAGIRLPMAALFESGGSSAVWLLDANTMKVRQQVVQLGGAEGKLVLIASGLSAGQEVVTAGVHVLTAGQTVRRYDADAQVRSASASPASTPQGGASAAAPATASR
jgi:RND family efflux transporter MFP subunit